MSKNQELIPEPKHRTNVGRQDYFEREEWDEKDEGENRKKKEGSAKEV